jgi:hypothetical protein
MTQYLYYNTVLQFRIEVKEDGTLGHPEKIGGFTNQMKGSNSMPIQQRASIAKKKEEKQKKDQQEKILDSLKTTVGEVQYD